VSPHSRLCVLRFGGCLPFPPRKGAIGLTIDGEVRGAIAGIDTIEVTFE
jgi:hypothetical protein